MSALQIIGSGGGSPVSVFVCFQLLYLFKLTLTLPHRQLRQLRLLPPMRLLYDALRW